MQPGNSKCGFSKMFGDYRRSAKKRNLPFELSKQEFRILTKQFCWYCGLEPTNMFRDHGCRNFYLSNGVDRVDNSKGYTWENCITACKTCNRMKSDLSGEQFIAKVRRIMSHLGI